MRQDTLPPEQSRRIADFAAIGLLAIVAALALTTFRHYGLGWDDYTHAEYGELLLAWYTSGFTDTRAFSFVNLYYYGGGFDVLAALVSRALSLDLFMARRLTGALVGLIGLAITWRLGRRLGGPWAGFGAVMLLALCPLYYGHMFMNPKDTPFAVAMVALTYGFVRAFSEYPRPSWRSILIFGLALGLTLGTRIMGGMAVLFAATAATLMLVIEARTRGARAALGRMGSFVGRLAIGLVPAYVVMGVVWPWAMQAPLNPLVAVGYFGTFFEVPWMEMFGGRQVLVPDMPRTYVPMLFALKMPEVFLLACISGAAGAVVAIYRGHLSVRTRAMLAYVLAAALVPILLTIAMRPAMYNGLRHFVFVTPPLAVLGGLALAFAGRRLAALNRPRVAWAAGAATLAAAAISVVDLARVHPYEYTHFNRLAGGIRAADRDFMLDYWGLAFKQAGEDLRTAISQNGWQPPGGRKWKVATCGPHPAARVALGPAFEITYDARGADFALMLGEFYCRSLRMKPVVKVERDGVVFARVYDIRNAPIATIYTTPPLLVPSVPSLP